MKQENTLKLGDIRERLDNLASGNKCILGFYPYAWSLLVLPTKGTQYYMKSKLFVIRVKNNVNILKATKPNAINLKSTVYCVRIYQYKTNSGIIFYDFQIPVI